MPRGKPLKVTGRRMVGVRNRRKKATIRSEFVAIVGHTWFRRVARARPQHAPPSTRLHLPFSTTGLKRIIKNSLSFHRVAVCISLLILTTILGGGFTEARGQGFAISLDEIGYLFPESPLDTIKTDDLAWLRIGKYFRVRNFIPPDLDRERTVEEYSLY